MGRKFEIPLFYRSPIISRIKEVRRQRDSRKVDRRPSILDLGPVRFKIARHFGFCFGVENAIETAYRALAENPSRRVFLLSEMIHNPHVNADLIERGVKFLMDTRGNELVSFDTLGAEDIVIVPAFGTTTELFARLSERKIETHAYNATCPFVERVWKRAAQLGERGFTVIIHGKQDHEETRATFSHARLSGPSLVIRDIEEARLVANYIEGLLPIDTFLDRFAGRTSSGFDPRKHLSRVGVVNQTTMLATETEAISRLLRESMARAYQGDSEGIHFADTRDTLCYATTENQDAVYGLRDSGGDLAIVVGGYNSSNTSHLAELLKDQLPTFYIQDADEIVGRDEIRHLDFEDSKVVSSHNWLPSLERPIDIVISAGASCPDALVDGVLVKLASLFGVSDQIQRCVERDFALQDPEKIVPDSALNY